MQCHVRGVALVADLQGPVFGMIHNIEIDLVLIRLEADKNRQKQRYSARAGGQAPRGVPPQSLAMPTSILFFEGNRGRYKTYATRTAKRTPNVGRGYLYSLPRRAYAHSTVEF